MSILFKKMTPLARDIAETKLRNDGILAPDAPLEYAFEVLPKERAALEKARQEYDAKIAECADDHRLAELAIAKAHCVRKEIDALEA